MYSSAAWGGSSDVSQRPQSTSIPVLGRSCPAHIISACTAAFALTCYPSGRPLARFRFLTSHRGRTLETLYPLPVNGDGETYMDGKMDCILG